MSIKFNLKNIRKIKNISQKRLAYLTGYSQSYISELETGIKSPTLTVIDKIATALKVSPFELIKVNSKYLPLILLLTYSKYIFSRIFSL